jgi:superfamily II DNA or RNA helicase
MMFPDFLEPFRKKSLQQLQCGQPTDILFSGPTYQVCCTEGDNTHWVFVQLDESDRIKDIFCSCESSSQNDTCLHMAIAASAIFSQSQPWHQDFQASLWNALFSPFIHEKHSPKHREGKILLANGQIVIAGHTNEIQRIRQLLKENHISDTSSIKFSNIPQEEIEAWNAGNCSQRLSYELSPYIDLAKFFYYFHSQNSCTFYWKQQKNFTLLCEFSRLSVEIEIRTPLPEILEKMIGETNQPLIAPFGGKKLLTISPKKELCTFTLSGEESVIPENAHELGNNWWHIPETGFVRTSKYRISSQNLPQFLDTIYPHTPSTPVQYHLDVSEKGLCISPYIEQPHDIEMAKGIFFKNWLFMHGKWIHTDHPKWSLPTHIPLENASSFLSSNNNLLAALGQPVHSRSREFTLLYEVAESGALILKKQLLATTQKSIIQIDPWIYVQDEGFFPKETQQADHIDQLIPPHHVPEFIKNNKDVLKNIQGFFAKHTPIHSVGLVMRATQRKVSISSTFLWDDPAYESQARIYDDFGYIPGIGFFPLPGVLVQHQQTKEIRASNKEQWDQFFEEQLSKLRNEFPCSVDPKMEPPKNLTLLCHGLDIIPEEDAPSQLRGSFFWKSELGTVSASQVLQAIRRKERWCVSNAGLLDLQEERFGWLLSLPPLEDTHHLRPSDLLKIQAHERFELEHASSSATNFLQKLLHDQPIPEPVLTTFRSQLRPYQHLGLQWLWHLFNTGLSGLLCDDMGVGKTYQAMALLLAIFEQQQMEGKHPQFLIVCPTSILWHWKDKLSEVLPQMDICLWTSGERPVFTKEHILLTSYGILRSSIASIKKSTFDVAIFDELQIAKNHVSQIWAALSQVRSSMRLGLTGTPIENKLRELKALFDLVLPGYFPKERLFREYYVRPIEKDCSQSRKALLAKFIQPFILRRRKADVLPDLPAKTEEIYHAELIGGQKELYYQVATRQGSPLLEQLRDTSTPIPYLHIFALLSSLKQICNHPASFLKDEAHFSRYDSGKWEMFVELLEEALEGNLKVVVFSQFLSMLDIMKQHLISHKVGYAELRGSTRQRGDVISRFREDPNCKVFLGSLQTSGLGIDLTAASVVIHYDRWWNAARENQATDRVHRLGQSRGVLVYKLMTQKSVEVNIDRMISRKSKLLEDVVGYDDHRIIQKLQRSELLELLEGIQEAP